MPRTEKLGSGMFCEIGPAAACVADNPEHNAPKSPQKHRLESIILFQQIVNQASNLARYSQICSGHVLVMFRPCFRPCSGHVPEDLQIRRNENRLSRSDLHKMLCFRKRLSIGLQGECSTNIGCACRQNAASAAAVYRHRSFPGTPAASAARRSVSEICPGKSTQRSRRLALNASRVCPWGLSRQRLGVR